MPALVDFNVEQIDAITISGPPEVAEPDLMSSYVWRRLDDKYAMLGAPQGLSYGQRQSEQMVNKSLSVAAKYIKFRGFVRLDELEVTGSPLVMFHPRSS